MQTKEKLLLKPENFKPFFPGWKIEGVFNPASIRDKSGKIILFARVSERFVSDNFLQYPVAIPGKKFSFKIEEIKSNEFLKQEGNMLLKKNHTYKLSNISHFRKITLDKTGFNIEKIEPEPVFYPTEAYEEFGVEDPRIVKINKDYLMTYASISSKNQISTSLAISNDLKKWKKLGIIFSHENKDVVLFPEKINGKYVALIRPVGSFNFSNPSIWISYSKDLKFWGNEKCIITPRNNSWEEKRIGSGPPPIKTKKGWLLTYHGVKEKTYSAGAVLFDLKNPEKILARTPKNKPLFYPDKDYEKAGFINNVIFPTGIVEDMDKKSVLIYSGTADKYISVKRVLIKDIINSLEKC